MTISARKIRRNGSGYKVSIAGRYLQSWGMGANTNGTTYSGTGKLRLYVNSSFKNIQVYYSNLYRPTGGYLTPCPNNFSVKASLEVDGTLYPIYFNGNRTFTFRANVAYCLVSDVLNVSITSGNTVYLRTYAECATGGMIPWSNSEDYVGSSNATQKGSDEVVDGSDLTDTPGNLNGAFSTGDMYLPVDVVATPTVAPYLPNVIITGDSIITNNGSVVKSYGTNEPSNTVQRFNFSTTRETFRSGTHATMPLVNATPVIPFTRISIGGDTLANIVSNFSQRSGFIGTSEIAICNYGINDINSNSTPTATMKSLYAQYYALLKGAGVKKVYQLTLSPYTTSTNCWVDEAGQTQYMSAGKETVRTDINTWFTSGQAVTDCGGNLDGVFDTAALVTDATGHKWKETDYAGARYDAAIETGTCNGTSTTNTMTVVASTFSLHTMDYMYVIHLTGGTGAGQYRIQSYDSPATKYYVTNNWTVQPDATTTYEILRAPTQDGLHPIGWGFLAASAAVNVGLFI